MCIRDRRNGKGHHPRHYRPDRDGWGHRLRDRVRRFRHPRAFDGRDVYKRQHTHCQQECNKSDLLHPVKNLATAQPYGRQPILLIPVRRFVPGPALSIVNGRNGTGQKGLRRNDSYGLRRSPFQMDVIPKRAKNINCGLPGDAFSYWNGAIFGITLCAPHGNRREGPGPPPLNAPSSKTIAPRS